MRCRACEYENAPDSETCSECGVGLLWTEEIDAREKFRKDLAETRNRAESKYARIFRSATGSAAEDLEQADRADGSTLLDRQGADTPGTPQRPGHTGGSDRTENGSTD